MKKLYVKSNSPQPIKQCQIIRNSKQVKETYIKFKPSSQKNPLSSATK